jgi:putative ABC transport system substrate-binding protein
LLGDDALVGNRLELLRVAMPDVAHVGILANPDDPSDGLTVARLPGAARDLSLVLQVFEVRDVTKLEAVSAKIVAAGVQALFVGPGPTLVSGRAEITNLVARVRLPAMYGFREFADIGGLVSYGPALPTCIGNC